jgi:cell wall-active antibiotic response 4TMS protein YvqF
MRWNRNLVGWGLFFIVFGVVLLGVRQGWISTELAGRAWQIWPLLLVGAGLSLLLSGRPGAWLGGLVAAVCLGVIAGGLVSTGVGLSLAGCGSDDPGTPFEHLSGELPAEARVSIDFDCGELTLRAVPGTTWGIDGQSTDGKPPTIDRASTGFAIEPMNGNGIFGLSGKRVRLDVTLPADPTIGLDVTLNAGEGRLTLAGAHLDVTDVTVNAGSLRLDLRDVEAVRTLDGTVNAGSAVVWLPDRSLTGNITVNAGSLSICAPEDVGLRLAAGSNPLSSNDFEEQGLVRSGDWWETPGFATAEIRIQLGVTANAGSMSLNPQENCSG